MSNASCFVDQFSSVLYDFSMIANERSGDDLHVSEYTRFLEKTSSATLAKLFMKYWYRTIGNKVHAWTFFTITQMTDGLCQSKFKAYLGGDLVCIGVCDNGDLLMVDLADYAVWVFDGILDFSQIDPPNDSEQIRASGIKVFEHVMFLMIHIMDRRYIPSGFRFWAEYTQIERLRQRSGS